MATSDADAKPARLPYFRLAASGRSKGVLRPRLRGAVMAWIVRPWCALALLHWSAGGKHADKARGKRTMRSRKSRRDHERSMDEEAARHSAAAASPR